MLTISKKVFQAIERFNADENYEDLMPELEQEFTPGELVLFAEFISLMSADVHDICSNILQEDIYTTQLDTAIAVLIDMIRHHDTDISKGLDCLKSLNNIRAKGKLTYRPADFDIDTYNFIKGAN